MNADWRNVSLLGGLGSFLGFLIAVLLYKPLKIGWMVYAIYAGLAAGVLVGLYMKKPLSKFYAAAWAFPLGAFSSLTLILTWVPGNAGMGSLYLVLGITIGATLFIKPASLTDAVTVPLTYLGGFVLMILVFKGHPPLSDNEFAVPVLFSVSGSATALAFFGSVGRWSYELARHAVGRRGNV